MDMKSSIVNWIGVKAAQTRTTGLKKRNIMNYFDIAIDITNSVAIVLSTFRIMLEIF